MTTSTIVEQIIEQLQQAGWALADIIKEPLISHAGRASRPDLVLLFHGYPLAVVEIKRVLTALPNHVSQVQAALDALGVHLVFATDGRDIIKLSKHSSEPQRTTRWPRPEELWTSLYGQLGPEDPRLASLPGSALSPRPHTAAAIARVLDAVVQGKPRILVAMAAGTGKSTVICEVISRLLTAGRARRVLCISEHRVVVAQLAHRFQQSLANRYPIESPPKHPSHASVQVGTARFIETPREAPRLGSFPADTFDFVILVDIPTWESRRAIAEHFAAATIIGFTTNPATEIREHLGEAVFSYSIDDAVSDEEIQTPEGYAPVRLGELVEISAGSSAVVSREEIENAAEGLLLRGADIVPFGGGLQTTGIQRVWLLRQHRQASTIRPNDIVLAAVGFTTSRRIALVPEGAPSTMVAASSVLRLRPRPGVDPRPIVEFLRSGMAGIALERAVSSLRSTTRVSAADLEGLRIFLPALAKAKPTSLITQAPALAAAEAAEAPEPPQTPEAPPPIGSSLGVAAVALRELREVILPKLSQSVGSSDAEADPHLPLIAEQLRKLAHSLSPPTLAEQVMETYPTPIALAYRRYHDARFDVFEQVLRLRDLFESATFFVFNVALADAFRRLDPKAYYVEKNDSRRAYDNFSIPPRMSFIEAITEKAKARSVDDLFMAELATSSVCGVVRELQSEFRNVLSHTMAGSESQQKKVLERFSPRVNELLASLSFLSRYQLVRIDSFHWKGERFYRRIEVLQGVALEIREEYVPDGAMPTKAPRDHLVLLDEDDRVLDLHPLYQFVATPQTHDQRHLCLFKRRSGAGLRGESLFGAFELDLDGAQEFEVLRKRLEKENTP